MAITMELTLNSKVIPAGKKKKTTIHSCIDALEQRKLRPLFIKQTIVKNLSLSWKDADRLYSEFLKGKQ